MQNLRLAYAGHYLLMNLQSEPSIGVKTYFHDIPHGCGAVSQPPPFLLMEVDMLKRFVDLLLTLPLIMLVSPIMLLIAIVIVLDTGFPILWGSERVGKNGHIFRLYQFRTMLLDEIGRGTEFTNVGRFIRNISLDHLPNLLNLINGNMSIVGSRPHEPHDVDMTDPLWQQVLSLKPGVISWAILNLATDFNASSIAERNKLELEYVQKQSLWFDFYVMWLGLRALVNSGGNVKARGTRRV